MLNNVSCLVPRQCFLILLMMVAGVWARGADLTCKSHFFDKTYRGEIQRQWDYYNLIKNHADSNGVLIETDKKDPRILLLKVLTDGDLKGAHPLNHLATSLFHHHDGVRVEINPRKLKVDEAGALFDEDAKRLTLAIDNVLDLKADSFVGHELRHAYS